MMQTRKPLEGSGGRSRGQGRSVKGLKYPEGEIRMGNGEEVGVKGNIAGAELSTKTWRGDTGKGALELVH